MKKDNSKTGKGEATRAVLNTARGKSLWLENKTSSETAIRNDVETRKSDGGNLFGGFYLRGKRNIAILKFNSSMRNLVRCGVDLKYVLP